MNIGNRLKNFAETQLVLTRNQSEREGIDTSLFYLEKIIKRRLVDQVKEVIRFGSYTRNTILPRRFDPHSDVDLMVVFDKENWDHHHGTYRKWLIDELEAEYPNSVVRKDFPVVKLELKKIMFDLVPAFSDQFIWKNYYVPRNSKEWQRTKPNDLNDDLKRGGGDLVNICRLCKYWNANAGYPYESYLLEKAIVAWLQMPTGDFFHDFLDALSHVARDHSGAKQAIAFINQYKGNWLNQGNPDKVLFWVQKLLPAFQG